MKPASRALNAPGSDLEPSTINQSQTSVSPESESFLIKKKGGGSWVSNQSETQPFIGIPAYEFADFLHIASVDFPQQH